MTLCHHNLVILSGISDSYTQDTTQSSPVTQKREFENTEKRHRISFFKEYSRHKNTWATFLTFILPTRYLVQEGGMKSQKGVLLRHGNWALTWALYYDHFENNILGFAILSISMDVAAPAFII